MAVTVRPLSQASGDPPPAEITSARRGLLWRWLIALALGCGTLACYWQVRHFGFVNYDDPDYVYTNPMVQQGLSWSSLAWAFRSTGACNWHPLTWLSHMLDCQLYGLQPGPHHLTNVVLHTATTVLLFLLLLRLTGATFRSGFVAAAFGWHPLHVESVAWISERKDVLSAFFFVLTLLAYAQWARAGQCPTRDKQPAARSGARSLLPLPGSFYYGLTLALYALGLMSKPMLVTLPFVLLLLDLWPLGRVPVAAASRSARGTGNYGLSALLLEKVPFLALAAISSLVTFLVQEHGGALTMTEHLPLVLRVQNALVAYVTYLLQFFWPGNLAAFYPYPASFPFWRVGSAAVLLALISWTVIRRVRQQPFLFTGWFWFLGMLVPVIGLVQAGSQARADRYTYLPYVGLACMVAWGAAALLQRVARGKYLLGILGVLVLAAGWTGSRAQARFWQDGPTLFSHVVSTTPTNYIAEITLGFALAEKGNLDTAETHHRLALQLYPHSAQAHCNLGMILGRKGHLEEALVELKQALALNPQSTDAYNNLGTVYLLQQQFQAAAAAFQHAVSLNPDLTVAHLNLGMAYAGLERWQDSAEEFRPAVRLAPSHFDAQDRFLTVLHHLGRTDEAVAHCRWLAGAMPKDPRSHFLLGQELLLANQPETAVAAFQESLRLAPANPAYLNQLAWVYATHPSAAVRHGAEAVRLAEQACALTKRQDASMLDTLSTALAETGNFEAACQAAQEAQTKALEVGDKATAGAAKEKLALYKAGQCYRENHSP